jgi:hypothetical protein
MMILVKSLLVGVAAVIVYLLLAAAIVWRLSTPPKLPPFPTDGGGFTWSGRWIPIWPIPIGAILVFVAASYWALKRIS